MTKDNLLQTSLANLDLLEAMQIKAVQEETLAHAEQLADITGSFAKTGEGLQADFDRANTELSLRRIEMLRAVEGTQVASVKLAQQLSAQQCQFLMPTEPAMTPIELVDHTCPCGDLITTGLSYRPELAESRHIVGEAIERYKREKYAPFVPSVLMGFSYGGNGGSIGNDIDNFGGRTDFDAAAYWEVRNLGFGEKAARREAHSGVEMARWQVVRQMDQISAEIAQAHVELRSRRSQVDLAQQAISAARNSYRRNQERIQAGQGLTPPRDPAVTTGPQQRPARIRPRCRGLQPITVYHAASPWLANSISRVSVHRLLEWILELCRDFTSQSFEKRPDLFDVFFAQFHA